VLLLLTSCKHEPQRFLLTDNENYSKTGVTDSVPPFPRIILQEVCFSVEESSCSLPFDHDIPLSSGHNFPGGKGIPITM
jgi:hypothetical protein